MDESASILRNTSSSRHEKYMPIDSKQVTAMQRPSPVSTVATAGLDTAACVSSFTFLNNPSSADDDSTDRINRLVAQSAERLQRHSRLSTASLSWTSTTSEQHHYDETNKLMPHPPSRISDMFGAKPANDDCFGNMNTTSQDNNNNTVTDGGFFMEKTVCSEHGVSTGELSSRYFRPDPGNEGEESDVGNYNHIDEGHEKTQNIEESSLLQKGLMVQNHSLGREPLRTEERDETGLPVDVIMQNALWYVFGLLNNI